MLIALALHICLCNLLIKPLVARPRPFTINTDIRLLITAPTDYSFPSGHTAASFAVAFSLLFGKNKLCSLAFILSALIAFSRLYLYVHYPTDVFAGILIGCFIGLISNAVYTAVSSRVKPVIPKGKAEQ
jgi:undecaprenyl-diphosphatase